MVELKLFLVVMICLFFQQMSQSYASWINKHKDHDGTSVGSRLKTKLQHALHILDGHNHSSSSDSPSSSSDPGDLKIPGCSIDIHKLPINHPWLVHPLYNTLVYPGTHGRITLKNEDEIMLVCSHDGKDNFLSHIDLSSSDKNAQIAIIKCIEEKLTYLGKALDISDFSCDRMPTAIMRKSNIVCDVNLKLYKVGFWNPQRDKIWTNVYDVCVDDKNPHMVFGKHTVHVIQRSKEHQIVKDTKSDFSVPAGLFPEMQNLIKYYNAKNQQACLKAQLGTTDYNALTHKGKEQFNQASFVPKEDFVYRAEQAATMFHVTSAPQWKLLNCGNYKLLEEDVRNLALDRGPLTVYTGIHGNLRVNRTRIDLNQSPPVNITLPIPNIFWKIVFDPRNSESIALVCHNKLVHPGRYICKDVTNETSWLQGWKKGGVHQIPARGICYACHTAQFLLCHSNILPDVRDRLSKSKLLSSG